MAFFFFLNLRRKFSLSPSRSRSASGSSTGSSRSRSRSHSDSRSASGSVSGSRSGSRSRSSSSASSISPPASPVAKRKGGAGQFVALCREAFGKEVQGHSGGVERRTGPCKPPSSAPEYLDDEGELLCVRRA